MESVNNAYSLKTYCTLLDIRQLNMVPSDAKHEKTVRPYPPSIFLLPPYPQQVWRKKVCLFVRHGSGK